ncbi:hypothetical protein OF83DRAFT_1098774 [Amylostereum chailletii]|nr:hypothetical protein OF83DRAFT_1098774 [Amylostereum chailletii]
MYTARLLDLLPQPILILDNRPQALKMSADRRPIILITGCTSREIGHSLALEFVEKNCLSVREGPKFEHDARPLGTYWGWRYIHVNPKVFPRCARRSTS